jgi:hypothetical protein
MLEAVSLGGVFGETIVGLKDTKGVGLAKCSKYWTKTRGMGVKGLFYRTLWIDNGDTQTSQLPEPSHQTAIWK